MRPAVVTQVAPGAVHGDREGRSAGPESRRLPGSPFPRLPAAFALRSAGVCYALAVLVAALVVLSAARGRPPYLAAANVGNLLEQASLTAILAIGMTVLLISGSFDLAVGSLTALTATVAALVANAAGPAAALVTALAVGTLGGLLNGVLHWTTGLNSFIVTLGTLTAFRGLTLLVSGSESVNVDGAARQTLESWLGGYVTIPSTPLAAGLILTLVAAVLAVQRMARQATVAGVTAVGLLALSTTWTYPLRLSHSTVVMLAVLLLATVGLGRTVPGRRLYAVGGNEEAARAAGIPLGRYRVVPFVVVGVCAGIAGTLWTARVGTVDPNIFTMAELQVLASAIVGGVALTGGAGTVTKSVVGALLLFVMSNGFNLLNVDPALQQVFTGVVVILAAGAYVVADRRARVKP